MTTKHTPGPWKAHKPGGFSPAEPDWVITGGVAPDPVTRARYLPVAKVYRTRDPNPMWRQDEDNEANARLIEAAPDLLAVAEVLAGLRMDAARTVAMGPGFALLVRDAQAAVEKARRRVL